MRFLGFGLVVLFAYIASIHAVGATRLQPIIDRVRDTLAPGDEQPQDVFTSPIEARHSAVEMDAASGSEAGSEAKVGKIFCACIAVKPVDENPAINPKFPDRVTPNLTLGVRAVMKRKYACFDVGAGCANTNCRRVCKEEFPITDLAKAGYKGNVCSVFHEIEPLVEYSRVADMDDAAERLTACELVDSEMLMTEFVQRAKNNRSVSLAEDDSFVVTPGSMPSTMTTLGFMHLGPTAVPVVDANAAAQHSICISGGGWRALSSAVGAFKALNERGYLAKAKALSSVSGGSWFLSSYAFSSQFYKDVTSNESASAVIQKWFTRYYARLKKNFRPFSPLWSTSSAAREIIQNIRSIPFLPTGIRQLFGELVEEFDKSEFSWENFVSGFLLEAIEGNDFDEKTTAESKNRKDAVTANAKLLFNFNLARGWNVPNEATKTFVTADVKDESKPATSLQYSSLIVHPTADNKENIIRVRGSDIKSVKLFPVEINEQCVETPGAATSFSMDPNTTFTVGKIASISSAAGGAISDTVWIAEVIQYIRTSIDSALLGCQALRRAGIKFMSQKAWNFLMEMTGCWYPGSNRQACHVAQKITMPFIDMSVFFGESNKIRGYDAGYSDNSGVSSAVIEAMKRVDVEVEAKRAAPRQRLLILIQNSRGDDQMERYFEKFHDYGNNGFLCRDISDSKKIRSRFESLGRRCVIPMPSLEIFQGEAPDEIVTPVAGVTFAYKKDTKLISNVELGISIPNEKAREKYIFDLLFVILNGEVSTLNTATGGMESYLGVSEAVSKAIQYLQDKNIINNFFA